MKNAVLLSIVLIISFHELQAKKLDSLNHENHKEFYLNWDNDIFLFRDFYYTQGAHLYWVNPLLRKNPANHIFLHLPEADNYFGVGIIQEIYTPKDINDSLLNEVDRPYAGTLFIRSFSVSSDPKKGIRLTSQLDLGIMGPLAGAREAQKLVHEWLNLGFPEGWDFQIANRPYINYNIQYERRIAQIPGFLDLTGSARARVGNIHNDLRLGTGIRIGLLNDSFKGNRLPNKKYTDQYDWELALFAHSYFSAVFYNATLMGGIIPPEGTRQFNFNEINNALGIFTGGIQLSYKFIEAVGRVTWKTAEFERGEAHGWGTISLSFRLN